MRGKMRKIVAFLLCAAMLVSGFPATELQAEDSASDAAAMVVVAQYDMSHADGKLTDISGKGNDAVLVGMTDDDFQQESEDEILVFDGDKNKYVTLPAGIIEGEEFSIEAVFKADNVSGENSWLWCLGTKVASWPDVNNYVFLCPAQGNNGNGKTGNIRAGIKDASTELLLGQEKAITADAYNTIIVEFDHGELTLSLNGEVVETISTTYSIQEILENGADGALGYIGKSLYSPDPAFSGSLTSFTIRTVAPEEPVDPWEAALEAVTLPYNTTDKQVYGNITLPVDVAEGVTVTWETSHPAIVDVNEYENEGYDVTPAGKVTRPSEDTDVTMTATITDGTKTEEKAFTFTVKAAPETISEEEYTDYFFAYFAGEGYADGEQIYFAASEDGLNWTDLNANSPILTSDLGEKGVRDPYIIRSAEGDKFYMIATDLKIYNGNGWTAAQEAGSQSIMVWESTDLVNWSDQRMVEISADIDAGCTWAPECYYDEITGEYVVYWASKTSADGYAKQRVYYAKTRDFYSFTEPEVFIDKDESSIDTTIIYDEEAGMYYRYTKNEGGNTNELGALTKTIFVEKSATLLGEWEHIASASLNDNQWVEGPAIFKFNSDDKDGYYSLLVDDSGGIGYYPLISDDLASGEFTVPSDTYEMPTRARHGTAIRITKEEYEAVMEKWGPAPDNTNVGLIADFDFDDESTGFEGGNAKATGTYTLQDSYDEENGKALYLDGSSTNFLTVTDKDGNSLLTGYSELTISMDIKPDRTGANWAFYAAPNANAQSYPNEHYIGVLNSNGSITVERYNNNGSRPQSASCTTGNDWVHLDIVFSKMDTTIYVDGVKQSVVSSVHDLKDILGSESILYIGKANWGSGEFYKGWMDNFKIYGRALTEEQLGIVASYSFDGQNLTNEGISGNQAKAIVTGLTEYSGNLVYETGRNGEGYALRLGSYGLELEEDMLGEEYTVSFWVKPDGTIAGNGPVVFLGYHNPENWMGISGDAWPATSKCKFWGNGGACGQWTTLTSLNIEAEWTHIAITGTKDAVTLYQNGKAIITDKTSNNPLNVENGDILIGVNNWDAMFQGLVDDINIYDRALTLAEVYALYDENADAADELEEKRFTAIESIVTFVGESEVIEITLPELVQAAPDLEITYQSADEDIVKVDAEGNVTAVGAGETTITTTVKVGDVEKTATTTVKVMADASDALVASYPFDGETLANVATEETDDEALALVTGLNKYTGNVVYEEGKEYAGNSVRIGDYGLKLNPEELGDEYTISFWTNLDNTFAENQILFAMGQHSPENWMALSGDTSGNFKFWGNGGCFNTWTTVKTVSLEPGNWHNIVLCGEADEVTFYLDGEELGTYSSNNPLSANGSYITIGVNNWDTEGVGLVDDVNVYSVPLTSSIVKSIYVEELFEMAEGELRAALGDTTSVKEDMTLPTTTKIGAEVKWTTSDATVVAADGTVTRPEEGNQDAAVELTATINVDGASKEVKFEVTVLAINPEADLAEAKEALILPEVISEDMELPTTGKHNTSITWKSSNEDILAADGTIVKRPEVGAGNAAVVLTAVISMNGKTVEKEFEIEVMEEFYGYILSYITGNDDRTGSLHLAHSTDGENFTALNSNSGILFAQIDTNNGNKTLSTGIRFTSLYLFRKADGTFGFTATQSNRLTSVYMYDSEDLISYTNERMVETGSTVGNPLSPEVEYDTTIGAYRINWKDASGNEYSSITTDLNVTTLTEAYNYAADTSAQGIATVPEGAIVGNVIQVTKAEYDKIVKKLGRTTNTGVEELTDIIVNEGDEVTLPSMIDVYYSDDSTTSMGIIWDTEGVDFTKAGVYEITGTIEQEIYLNPLIEERADPHIEYDEEEGCYYFTASYPAYNNVNNGYDRIILRKADTIAGLTDAQEITIWEAPESGLMSKHVWAPEIHKIEGKWYVFFAAGSDNIWAIRPYVLVCQDNSDPYNPESWVNENGESEIHAATSKNSAYFKNMSLDMTYFEHNGKHYVIWADIIGQSALYMQEIDPSEPWAGTSDEVICLTTPEFGWERDSERVNEGPSVIKNDGKIYVAFSGSGTGPEYCIGLLYADEDSDLMDEDSWTKVGYPVLTSSDVPGEYGPGHNSFTVDENGNAIFVYHARSEECYNNECDWANSEPLYDPCRHARVKRVHWAADGTPILNMSYEEELKEEFKTVSITVTVLEENVVDKSILETTVTDAKALNKDDYTEESWKVFEDALEHAENILADENVSQEDVNDALQKLEDAIDSLKKPESPDDGDDDEDGKLPDDGDDEDGKLPDDEEDKDDGKLPDEKEDSSEEGAVSTGDVVNTGLWISVMLAAAVFVAVYMRKRRVK